jgi:hypothetical protein
MASDTGDSDATHSWAEKERDLQLKRQQEKRRRQLYQQKIQLRRHKKVWGTAAGNALHSEKDVEVVPPEKSTAVSATRVSQPAVRIHIDALRRVRQQIQQQEPPARQQYASSLPTKGPGSHKTSRDGTRRPERGAKAKERRRKQRESTHVGTGFGGGGRKDGRHHAAEFPVDVLEALFDGTLNMAGATDTSGMEGDTASYGNNSSPRSPDNIRRGLSSTLDPVHQGPSAELYAKRRLNDALEASQEVDANKYSEFSSEFSHTGQMQVESPTGVKGDYSDDDISAGSGSGSISEDSWEQPTEGLAGYEPDDEIKEDLDFKKHHPDPKGLLDMVQPSDGTPGSSYVFALLSPMEQIERMTEAITKYGNESKFSVLASQFVHEYSEDPEMLDIGEFRCSELVMYLIHAIEKYPIANLPEAVQLLVLLLNNHSNAEDAAQANVLSHIFRRLKGVQESIREVNIKLVRDADNEAASASISVWKQQGSNLSKVEALLIQASVQIVQMAQSQTEGRKIKRRLQRFKQFMPRNKK